MKLFLYVVEICEGEALRQVEEIEVDNARSILNHFIVRFSDAQTSEIKARETDFLLGMPDQPGEVAFPPRCNMPKKLINSRLKTHISPKIVRFICARHIHISRNQQWSS